MSPNLPITFTFEAGRLKRQVIIKASGASLSISLREEKLTRLSHSDGSFSST